MPVLVQRQCKARKAGWRLSGWLNADELDKSAEYHKFHISVTSNLFLLKIYSNLAYKKAPAVGALLSA